MPCLKVPLTNAPDLFAVVDQHSHARLVSQGLTGSWFLNDNGSGRSYVRTFVPTEGRQRTTNLQVARLIVGAGPRTVVRYANGDPLDLRYGNLAWRKGPSKRRDDDLLAAARRLRKPEAGARADG
jgi:hypothetical protein